MASSRLIDENFLYEATFQPANGEPFWQGHIKKYNLNSRRQHRKRGLGRRRSAQGRRRPPRGAIYTYKAGAQTSFTTSNITSTDLNVADDTRRNEVVGFIRGESAYNPDNWKLGDTFRSNPITVGTPAKYYRDTRDTANAFAAFRTSNARSTANGKRIVVAGANDGQIHAFRTSDGAELWSFIAPNLLSKLKDIAHSSHPTGLTHQYYVDGPISVADVWLGSGDGTTKSASDWKTLLVFAQGRGATQTLWSSSSSCDGGFSNVYSAGNPYYCGYHALDITNTAAPVYKWRITPSASQAPYLGDPWSKMMVSRVKVGGAGEVGRVHRRGTQLLELHRDGLRHPGERVLRRRAGHRQRPVEPHPGRQLGHGLCDARDPDDDRFRQRWLHRRGLHRRSGRQSLALQVLLDRRRVLLLDRQLDRLAALRAGGRHRPRLRRPDGDPGHQRQHLALLGHRRQGRAHRRGQRHGPVLRREGQNTVRHASRSATSKTSRAAPIPTTPPRRAGTSTSREPARSASPTPPSSGARSTSPPTPLPAAGQTPAARRARQSSMPSPTSPAPGP